MFALAACSTTGAFLDDETVQKIEAGMTPAQVREILGDPTTDIEEDGLRRWTYRGQRRVNYLVYQSTKTRVLVVSFRDGLVTFDTPHAKAEETDGT